MYDDERWADLPGYDGVYKVSDRGRVLNVRRKKFLTGTVTAGGYLQVRLTRPGERARAHLVHALVLTTFAGPRPYGSVCNHKSGKKLENELGNLEWCTPKQNVAHAARMGLLRPNPPRGEKHYRAKLTDGRVRAIRERHRAGGDLRRTGAGVRHRPGAGPPGGPGDELGARRVTAPLLIFSRLGRNKQISSEHSVKSPPNRGANHQRGASMGKTLHLIFDLDSRSFLGASSGGRFISGVSSVVLGGDTVSVLDHQGRDLLGGEAEDDDSAPDTKAMSDVAKAFGADGPPDGPQTAPFDYRQWSRR